MYAAAWLEIHRHWLQLLNDLRANEDSPSVMASGMEQRTAKTEEWRNLTLFLAATLSCCSTGGSAAPSFPRKHLPPRLRIDQSLKETVDQFLDQLVQWLVSKSLLQRETALEAVCFELDPSFYPDLLFKLDGSVYQSSIFGIMIA